MDLLIMDREEALHLSGKKDLAQAGKFFMDQGVSSFIITNGTENTICYSDGSCLNHFPLKISGIGRTDQ